MLPALPIVWADGSVMGLRVEGNFTIAMKWNAGHLVQCSIFSGSGVECRVYYPDLRLIKIKNSRGVEVPVSFIGDDLISFPTEAGEKYILKMERIGIM